MNMKSYIFLDVLMILTIYFAGYNKIIGVAGKSVPKDVT